MTHSAKAHVDPTRLFDRQADLYARARPTYPDALFAWLVAQAPAHPALAWDCACGSGQASVALARHIAQVVATDASAAPLERAPQRPNIAYHRAPAEHAPMVPTRGVALVTVATAAHWFDLEAFYQEAARVLVPGGLLAMWSYGVHRGDEALDAWTARFNDEVLGPYWVQPGHTHTASQYRTLSAAPADAFIELAAPPEALMQVRRRLDLDTLKAYLRSWSATQRYIDAQGHDPLIAHGEALRLAWGDAREREIVYPLFMRLFKRL